MMKWGKEFVIRQKQQEKKLMVNRNRARDDEEKMQNYGSTGNISVRELEC